MERTLIAALVADIRDAHDASLDGFHEAARETLLGAMQAGNAFLAAPAPAVLRRDDGSLSGVFVAAPAAPSERADPETDWPIARLRFDAGGTAVDVVKTYTPGLPEGEHDVWCVPVARPQAAQSLTCTWRPHDDIDMPGTWEAGCGALWTFTEGGPRDNDMRFCPQCGKPAVEVLEGGAA